MLLKLLGDLGFVFALDGLVIDEGIRFGFFCELQTFLRDGLVGAKKRRKRLAKLEDVQPVFQTETWRKLN